MVIAEGIEPNFDIEVTVEWWGFTYGDIGWTEIGITNILLGKLQNERF